MKLTSEELAKLLGIKIGDKIKFSNGRIVDVIKDYELDFHPLKASLSVIIDEEFEILTPKKKIGELKCRNIKCSDCPLRILACSSYACQTLFENLEITRDTYDDQEIYNILKARLDKEVEE